MTTPHDDLQDFLDGNDPLNELYARREPVEPPAELDAAILSAARDHAKHPQRPRWMLPISLAATVVLGTGLAVKQLSSPIRPMSESATHETLAQNGASTRSASSGEVAEQSPSVDSALVQAPVDKPRIEDIPAIEAEADFAPEPVQIEAKRVEPTLGQLKEADLSEARKQAQRSVQRDAPEAPRESAATPASAPAPAPAPPLASASNDRADGSVANEVIEPARPPTAVATEADIAAEVDIYEQAHRDSADKTEDAAIAATRKLRSRTYQPQTTFSFAEGQGSAQPGASLAPDRLAGATDAQLDQIINAIKEDRLDDALNSFKAWRLIIDSVYAQPEDEEQLDGERVDIEGATRDRIQALLAAGDTGTANDLQDILFEVYPNSELPVDLLPGEEPAPDPPHNQN
jgi:hypothetical protein